MQPEELFSMVFVMGMFAGVFVIFMAMRQRSQLLEMQHREKMAMIERGLALPPERPHAFVLRERPSFAGRSMTFGIVLIGIGFGFMSIVGIAAGAPEVGVGIGGAFGVVGVAFIVNSLLSKHDSPPATLERALDPPRPPEVPPL